MLLLVEASSQIAELFGQFGYWGPFLILLGAGAGLPVPEEVTLVGSGYLLHQGRVEFLPVVLVCAVATLLGDSIPFWTGRLLGKRALRIRLFEKALHPERMALIQDRLERHGHWAIFTCRFLPGLRLPGFFGAGTLEMSYGRFMALDGLGACLMVPAYIHLGRTFGEKIGVLEQRVQQSTELLGFVLLILVAFVAVRALGQRRDRQAAELDSDPPPGQDPPAGS